MGCERKRTARGEAKALSLGGTDASGTGQGYARPPDSLQPGGGQLLGAAARSVDRSSGCRQGSVEKFAGPGLDKGSLSTEEQLKYD